MRALFIFGLLVASISAYAQLHSWRDEDGRANVSDAPPPRSCQSQDCKKFHAAEDLENKGHEAKHQEALLKERLDKAEQARIAHDIAVSEQKKSVTKKEKEAKLVQAYKGGYEFANEERQKRLLDRRKCPRSIPGAPLDEVQYWQAFGNGCTDAYLGRASKQ